MSQITNQVSVAANTTIENVLSGSEFEFLSAPSAVSVANVAAATGVTGKFSIGSRIISSLFFVKVRAALGINVNEDILISDVGQAGERLKLSFTNTTAGALVVEFMVSVQPLA